MAEPETQYEYGSTPEDEQGGIWPLLSQFGGLFTPERREVVTPSTTTYTDIDGMYSPETTPGVYGPVERGMEYMPVVQGAKSAYDFAGKFFSDGKFREETGSALKQGISTLLEDQKRAAINAALGGGLEFYDPKQKRVVSYDPLLTPATMGAAGFLAPVKGPGMVTGMFAGRNAATADPKKFARADEMASKGRSREDIWKETGLFRWERNGEPVSDWRFEISDEMSQAVFNPRVQTPTGLLREKEKPVLSDLLEHPEFYKAFPGKSLISAYDEDFRKLSLRRADLKAELVALKKSGLSEEELDAETKRLEGLDGDLIRELINSIPTSAAPGLPPSVKSAPPFIGSRGVEARMERPVAGIPLKTMSSKDWGGAYYSSTFDNIGTKVRPGSPDKYGHIPWDEQGKYVQPFSSAQYDKAMGKAVEDFKEAGISLDTSTSGGKTEYRLRKWGGGPEDAVNPKDLPDFGYTSLKRQWDQLQAFGKIFYKKDYDPALRFRGDMIHEGQHVIQSRTPGFEPGANRREFLNMDVRDPVTGKKLTATETYMRTFGETEARAADARKDLTDKERDERFPWTREGGLDRREDDLLLRKDLEGKFSNDFSSNSPPTSKMPKLKIDNPGGKWLEGKLEQAADDRRTGRGGPSGPANITGYFEKDLSLPPGLLKDIPGELGEEAYRNTSSKLAALKKSIREEGYKPTPILIHVREDGKPFIIEGNHRVAEAAQSGRSTIPVEIKYLRGGEGADGPLSPTRLKDFFLPEVKKASGGFVDKPLYDNARVGGLI